ncbi:MAG TPA: CBS domain-containing protein [Solirubrobacteraceae bacterium]|nr:CBS domain-containing protein [Solirubrobacteraceae bacterium]
MTHDPRTVSAESTLTDAAVLMRDDDVGAIVVEREGAIAGVVTDRDIVVRAIAQGHDPATTQVGDVASESVVTVTPDQSVEDVRRLMREHDVRRIVVEQGGRAAGIVSLGDLAVDGDADAELTDISAASPNR